MSEKLGALAGELALTGLTVEDEVWSRLYELAGLTCSLSLVERSGLPIVLLI